MALVSYGINNSSDEEDDQNGALQSNPKPTIRSTIPPPKRWCSVPNDISLIERNRTRPVRILAPSLHGVFEERQSKLVKSTLGSGLMSILPEPKHLKNDSSLQQLRRKKNKNSQDKCVDSSEGSTVDSDHRHSERSGGSGLPSFFFTPLKGDTKGGRSTEDDHEMPSANLIHSDDIHQDVTNENIDMTRADTAYCTPANHVERPSSSSLNADDLVQLCGSHGKHLTSEDINLIEIDGSNLVNPAEMKMNNVKSLTYDYNSLYRQHKFKSSRRERSKHQITYLVEHAKFFEREVSQYPKNSKMSQNRYGF